MELELILTIIDTVALVFCGLILFNQNTTIKNLKIYSDIVNVQKLNDATNYIVKGESNKIKDEFREKEQRYRTQIESMEKSLKHLSQQQDEESLNIYHTLFLLTSKLGMIIEGSFSATLTCIEFIKVLDKHSTDYIKFIQFTSEFEKSEWLLFEIITQINGLDDSFFSQEKSTQRKTLGEINNNIDNIYNTNSALSSKTIEHSNEVIKKLSAKIKDMAC